MKTIDVIMARIYLTENEAHLSTLLKRLHDWERVRGVTVFRGVSGFGNSGKLHSASLLEISGNLPVVVEFFDEPARMNSILEHLSKVIEPGHMVSWPATLTVQD